MPRVGSGWRRAKQQGRSWLQVRTVDGRVISAGDVTPGSLYKQEQRTFLGCYVLSAWFVR